MKARIEYLESEYKDSTDINNTLKVKEKVLNESLAAVI
jgi:hypothetical protein